MSPACWPAEPPKRIFRVWGRHGGPILVLRATHSATGCVPWVWNDQTGNTNRLPIRRVDSPYMSPACWPAEPPKRIFRVWGRHGGPILVLRATHSATGCVPWVWNDQTGNTNRLPIRRVDSPYMSPACWPAEPPKRIFRVWGRHGGPILVLRATHSATGCVPWVWNDQTGNTNRLPIRRVDSPYMSPACWPAEPPKRIFRVWGRHGGPILVLRATHSATGCVPWDTAGKQGSRLLKFRTSRRGRSRRRLSRTATGTRRACHGAQYPSRQL